MYHAIGNHEMDVYYLDTVVDFLALSSSYYSFE